MGRCTRLILRQGLFKVVGGLLVLLVQQGYSSNIVQRGGELRVILERLCKVLARDSPLAQLEFDNAYLVIEQGILAVDAKGCQIVRNGVIIIVVNTRQVSFHLCRFGGLQLVLLCRVRG